MIIYTLKRSNGDTAHVRTAGKFNYAADVTSRTGESKNQAWPELYKTPRACKEALEKHGFTVIERD